VPLQALAMACDTGEHEAIRSALDDLSWPLLDAMLSEVPRDTLLRVANLTARFEDDLSPVYRRILGAVRRHAGAS
jgi:hypothetical protein